jgi:hypothetical protein
MEIQTAVDAIVERASSDADFSAQLIADPRGTIERESNMPIPAEWEIEATLNAEGGLEIGLANEQIPDEFLALVGGGSGDSSAPSMTITLMCPTCGMPVQQPHPRH